MDGLDDFGVVDPAQIRGPDREVGMPELALDHEQRDPFAGHLDGVRVPELVRREPVADAGSPGTVQLAVSLRERASLMRSPPRQSTTITPRNLMPSGAPPAAAMTATISSTVGGSGGYLRPFVARRKVLVEARQGRRRAEPPGAIQQRLSVP